MFERTLHHPMHGAPTVIHPNRAQRLVALYTLRLRNIVLVTPVGHFLRAAPKQRRKLRHRPVRRISPNSERQDPGDDDRRWHRLPQPLHDARVLRLFRVSSRLGRRFRYRRCDCSHINIPTGWRPTTKPLSPCRFQFEAFTVVAFVGQRAASNATKCEWCASNQEDSMKEMQPDWQRGTKVARPRSE